MGLLDNYGYGPPDLLPDVGQQKQPDPAVQFKGSLRTAQYLNPDELASDFSIGKKVDLAPDFVAADRQMARQKAAEDDAARLFSGAPIARSFLGQKPTTLALTQDDLHNVVALESLLSRSSQKDPDPINQMTGLDWLGASAKRAVEAGDIQNQIAYLQMGPQTAETAQKLAELKANMPKEPSVNGWLETGWVSAMKMAPQLWETFKASQYRGMQGAMIGGTAGAIGGLGFGAIPGATAGYFAGVTTGAAENSFLLEGGGAKDEFKDIHDENGQPLDPAMVEWAANGVGVVNAGIEMLQIGGLIRSVPGGQKLLSFVSKGAVKEALKNTTVRQALTGLGKFYVAEVGKETGQEVAQEIVTVMGGELAKMGSEGNFESITPTEFWERMADTAYQSATAFSLMMAPGNAMKVRGEIKAARQAQLDSNFFKALDDNVAASKLRERLPEAHAELVEAIRAEGGTPEAVYIEAAKLREATGLDGTTFSQLLTDIGVDPDEFARAEKLQADVAIPFSQYASRVAGTELSQKLREDVKFSADGMSQRQAKEFEQTYQERVQAAMAEQQANQQQSDAEMGKVVGEYKTELKRLGMNDADADASLQPLVKGAGVAAARWSAIKGETVTPAQWLTEVRNLQVRAVENGVQQDGTLNQDHPAVAGVDMNNAARVADAQKQWAEKGVESPYFKKWFGDSRVVGKDGKPLVVYHGTPDNRGIYEDGFGTLGERLNNLERKGPYFFTDNKRVADTYADDRRALDYQGANPETLATYIKMANPLRVDVAGASFRGVRKKDILAAIENGAPKDNWARELERVSAGRDSITTDMLGSIARRFGYDGVVVQNVRDNYAGTGPKSNVYMVFGNTNIKSVNNRGTFDASDPRILMQSGQPAFYSQLERVLTAKLANGTAAQHLKTLDAWAKKGEFKAEELEWSGLREWLAAKGNEKVPKEEVLNFLRQDGVKIEEVVKGSSGEHVTQDMIDAAEVAGNWDEYDRLTRIYEDQELGSNANDTGNETKFGQYQLPGGENYRELLLTLPSKASMPALIAAYKGGGSYDVLYPDGKKLGTVRAGSESEAIQKAWNGSTAATLASVNTDFKSSHFSEPNILAHVRFNERTDADGKRVLFIEEIQSDWAQEGRKKGFGDRVGAGDLEAKWREPVVPEGKSPDDYQGYWDVYRKSSGEHVLRVDETRQYTEREVIDKAVVKANTGVPDAPFVKNTSAWSMLAMKRMIRWAAENGFERVAWTTGEQQAERYDLSKQVKLISAMQDRGGKYLVYIEGKDGSPVFRNANGFSEHGQKSVTPQEFEELVGKEAAAKLIEGADKKKGEWYDSKPEGLKVGGEGMKGFYDKILPNETNKLIKKWGGKVGETSLDAGEYKVNKDSRTPPFRLERTDSPDIISRHNTAEEAWDEAERLGSTTAHSFDITPQMREGAMAGQALFQNVPQGTRGSITFTDQSTLISLFKGSANFSTMLHETAHLFVNDMENMVATGKAPEQVVKDLAALKAYAGDLTTVAAQEKLARSFEAYLREGKAPSAELRSAFGRFRAWLTAIYRDVRAQLGVELNDEARGVFDRMLATEDEINKAESSYATDDSALSEMLTPAEQKRIAELKGRSHEEALEKRTQRYVVAYMKALGGKKAFEAQAMAEVEAMPVYKTVAAITAEGGLPVADMDERFGQQARSDLALKFPGLVNLKEGSIFGAFDVDMMAVAQGYKNGEALIQALQTAKPKGQVIRELTSQKIAAEEARIREQLKNEAPTPDEDIHSNPALEKLVLEAKALERKISQTTEAKAQLNRGLNTVAMREVARGVLAETPLTQAMRYDRHSAAERRAGIEAERAIKKGKWGEALAAKEREALNHALVLESIKLREQTAKDVKRALKIARSQSMDFAAKEHVLDLVQTYKLGTESMAPARPEELGTLADYFNTVYADDEFGLNPLQFFSPWVLNKENPGSYKALTVNQFSELTAIINALADAGGSEFARMVTEQDKTRQEKIDELVAAVIQSGYTTKKFDKGTVAQRVTTGYRDVLASLQKMPDLFRNADGNVDATAKTAAKMGPNQAFGERIFRATTKMLEMLYAHKDLKEIEAQKLDFAKRFQKQFGERTAQINGAEVSAVRQAEGTFTWTAEMVWSVALNMGNEGNLRTLMVGDGMTEQQLGALTRILTTDDWRAIQKTWDMMGQYYSETDKVFRQVYGFPMPSKVAAQPLTVRTAEGTDLNLPGGYFPIKVDPEVNPDIGTKQEQDLLKGDPRNKFTASVAKGHTKERQGTSRPATLSYEVAHRALHDQAKFIALAPVIKDARGIFSNLQYRRAMVDAFGKDAFDEIMPWLKNIANPVINNKDSFDSWMNKMRHLSTLYILGLNIKSASKQYLGLAGAANKLGVRWTASGFSEMAKWGGMGVDFVNEQSAFMKNRDEGLNPELAEINAKARGKEFRVFGVKTGLSKKQAVDAVMVLTRLADRHVTYSVWLGAFKRGQAEGMTHQESVEFADRMVRRTQMSGSPVDVTGWQRDEGGKRFLTMFMSEAIPKSSRMRSDFNAYKNGKMSAAQYARSLFYESIAPAVGYTALMFLVGAASPKDWWKELFWQFYNETIGTYPLLGSASSALQYGQTEQTVPGLTGIELALKVAQKGGKLTGSSEDRAKFYKALVDTMAYIHGVGNLRRVYETAAEGWEDIDRNKTANPFRLFFRKPKEK
jgi:hypothetical protein